MTATAPAKTSAVSPVAVAPMMDWTDRHCRYFFRLLSADIRLYTEMVVAQALLHGDAERLLAHDAADSPVALQLGGSDPDTLEAAVRIAADYGYDEINLNIGCPSDRVQSGRFGACLMAEPGLVAECVAAMRAAATVPVTVKTRIGIDDHDSYDFLTAFIDKVAAGGCDTFIVHARKAILSGLSPKENRTIPPLKYDTVYRLKREHPDLSIVINGGIESVEAVREHLESVDGVMIGRRAYAYPYMLAELQHAVVRPLPDQERRLPDRRDIIAAMAEYADRQLGQGVRLHHISRHMLGLYAGQPGARNWRRFISERGQRPGAGPEVLLESLDVFDAAA